MLDVIKQILSDWYDQGCATWKYRGAPGEDGKWGGSFHYMDDDLEVISDGYCLFFDIGSASEKAAIGNLKDRLSTIGYSANYYKGKLYIIPTVHI